MARTEPTVEELVARFEKPGGFRRYFGPFRRALAREAHELYVTAEARGALRSVVLDERQFDGSQYVVRAIATEGELDERRREELARHAALVPLGTIRFEGMIAATLPQPVGSAPDASEVHALSRLDDGIIVYPVTELTRRSVSTFALWARFDDEYFVFPLTDRRL